MGGDAEGVQSGLPVLVSINPGNDLIELIVTSFGVRSRMVANGSVVSRCDH